MSPEKDPTFLASLLTGLLGLLGVVFGFVYRGQNRQIATIRKDVDGCVTDKTSLERFGHVTETLKGVQEQTEKQWGAITDTGKEVAGMNAKLDLIIENSARRRQGDR